MTIFWIKSTFNFFPVGSIFFYLFKNKIIFNIVKFVATKKRRQQIFSLFCCCWIRDQGWINNKNQDPG
jgi:hypothetical protein